MDSIRDKAIAFEGVKTSLSQNKDGMILRLAIHPNECPPQLLTDWVGTRYQVALVRIGDNEEPVASDETIRANRAIQSAGMLCRNEAFHKFMIDMGYVLEVEPMVQEQAVANAMREMLGIQSRSDFKTNAEALSQFEELKEEFLAWRKRNPLETKTERRT